MTKEADIAGLHQQLSDIVRIVDSMRKLHNEKDYSIESARADFSAVAEQYDDARILFEGLKGDSTITMKYLSLPQYPEMDQIRGMFIQIPLECKKTISALEKLSHPSMSQKDISESHSTRKELDNKFTDLDNKFTDLIQLNYNRIANLEKLLFFGTLLILFSIYVVLGKSSFLISAGFIISFILTGFYLGMIMGEVITAYTLTVQKYSLRSFNILKKIYEKLVPHSNQIITEFVFIVGLIAIYILTTFGNVDGLTLLAYYIIAIICVILSYLLGLIPKKTEDKKNPED